MPSLFKERMFEEIKDQFEANPYAFISSFEKLPVQDVSELRRSLDKVAKRSVLLKHTFARRIFKEINCEKASEYLEAQVLVTLGNSEPQAISKALADFAKAKKGFATKGVIFEKEVHGEAYVRQLSELPSREELLVQLLVRVQSPMYGVVNTLSQIMRGLVQALSEIKKQKEAGPQPA